MKQFTTINELTTAWAENNIANGIKNDLQSEVNFAKTCIVPKNRLDANMKYGIDSKIHEISGFGYVVIL